MKTAFLFLLCLVEITGFGQIENVPDQPSARALVVGISDFQDAEIADPPLAARDAEALTAWLRTRKNAPLPAENIALLTDSAATLAAFTAALDWLMEENRPPGPLLVFYSGHARRDENATPDALPMLLFHDSPVSPLRAGSVSLATIYALLSETARRDSVPFFLFSAFEMPENDRPDPPGWQLEKTHRQTFFSQISPTRQTASRDPQTFATSFLVGVLGLAETDFDERVNGYELTEFLKKQPASPASRAFVAFSKNAPSLSETGGQNLERIGQQARMLLSPVVQIDMNGPEKATLAQADSFIRERYENFMLALKIGHLMTPRGRSANDFYQLLATEKGLAAIHGQMRRQFAAALQDDTQQALNAWLQADARELNRRLQNPDHYRLYPLYLTKAIELLGKKHFMANLLEAKKLYFEGLVNRLDARRADPPDSMLLHEALTKQAAALAIEPDAAFILNEAGVIHFLKKNMQAAIDNFQAASRLSPAWAIPPGNLCLVFDGLGRRDSAIFYGKEAVRLAPSNPRMHNNLGLVYLKKRYTWPRAKAAFKRSVAIDPYFSDGWYNLACLFAKKQQPELAIQCLKTAFETGFDDQNLLETDADLKNLRGLSAFETVVQAFFEQK